MARYVLLLLMLFSTATVVVAEEVVGHVKFARGATTAQHPAMGTRILGKGAEVYQQDVISTALRSFIIIDMADGTSMTIRPSSSLEIESYIARRGPTDNAVLKLFKGGLRTITGFISKSRDDAYKVRTPVATIGIRGTEFDARLCGEDCQKEFRQQKKRDAVDTSRVIGRVAFMRGKLSATLDKQKSRQLFVGGSLYEGDRLRTGAASFAVLAFKDQSRITLQANSEFIIKQHYYDKKKPDSGQALMELVRGGLRAVSGLIGKKNKQAYRMRTPVATIGIRGTGYDILCEGSCVGSEQQSLNTPIDRILNLLIKPAYAELPTGDGLYAHVWSGIIELINDAGTQVLNENQVAFLSGMNTPPVMLPDVPIFMRANPAPRPDTINIDPGLFDSSRLESPEPGLYVSVYDGHVSLNTDDGGQVDLGQGEAAYAGPGSPTGAPVRLTTIPGFLTNDPYPRPEEFNEAWERLFNEVTNRDENEDLECTVR